MHLVVKKIGFLASNANEDEGAHFVTANKFKCPWKINLFRNINLPWKTQLTAPPSRPATSRPILIYLFIYFFLLFYCFLFSSASNDANGRPRKFTSVNREILISISLRNCCRWCWCCCRGRWSIQSETMLSQWRTLSKQKNKFETKVRPIECHDERLFFFYYSIPCLCLVCRRADNGSGASMAKQNANKGECVVTRNGFGFHFHFFFFLVGIHRSFVDLACDARRSECNDEFRPFLFSFRENVYGNLLRLLRGCNGRRDQPNDNNLCLLSFDINVNGHRPPDMRVHHMRSMATALSSREPSIFMFWFLSSLSMTDAKRTCAHTQHYFVC